MHPGRLSIRAVRSCTAFFAAALLAFSCPALLAAPPTGFVSVEGTHFVAPDGSPILLKGIGLGNWLLPEGYMLRLGRVNSPRLIGELVNQLIGEEEARKFWKQYRDNYVTRADIQLLKEAGFNCVRVAFDYRLFVTESDPVNLDGPGYNYLDRVVEWSREAGLYVVLDMHAAPGGQTGANIDNSYDYPFLFESEADQDLAIALWRKLAERYRAETAVLGYDLLNEPIAPYFNKTALNQKLEPLYKRMVAAIREVDTNHIVLLGGAQWNTNFKVFGPPFDDKAAYTFHLYWSKPAKSAVQKFLDFRDLHQVPLWLGESGENKDQWITRFRGMLEANDVGWCFWPYKKLKARSCVTTIRVPEDWSLITKFAALPRTTPRQIRRNRIPPAQARKVLWELLENMKVENCATNKGYLRALGLKSIPPAAMTSTD